MATGIHHVTLITRNVQANVDFYMGFLGLHLVKQTGGYEDAEQLHLFYGDPAGTPGSLVTFLVWEDGAPGRVGHGQVAEIAFAIPLETVGDWLTRAIAEGIRVEGPVREFGETVLRLRDPDGVIVKLVGLEDMAARTAAGTGTGAGAPAAPARLRAATLWSEKPEETAAFLARFGYREGAREGGLRRLVSDTDAIDLRDASGFVPGIPGTGVADHVAFRAPDVDAVRRVRLDLGKSAGLTNVHDRKYFLSLYVREPAGILLEYATDGPGFSVDEAPDHLGEELKIPPGDAARAEDLRIMLPQFARPGEERMPRRNLPFVHRFRHPARPDGTTLVLLHGSAGTEADLMPLAARIAPDATLLGVRGRATEEGSARWFRRLGEGRFDQADIAAEAEAFAAFLDGAVRGYGLDPARITLLGHSNGANFAAAAMGLRPGLARKAILIRPAMVLADPAPAALDATAILSLTGARDPTLGLAGPLHDWLRASGADLAVEELDAGHALLPAEDSRAARAWLAPGR